VHRRLALALALISSSCQAAWPNNPDYDQATPATATPTIAPPPSRTPIEEADLGGVTTPDSPSITNLKGRWKTYDPRDPAIPGLVQLADGVYHVDPAWQAEKIEYVYEWWGQGESILDYQVVRREGDGYYLGNAKIEDRPIAALVASLGDLHPSQYSLVALSANDSYPSWRMELVGEDGRRLLVYSSSTGNPGAAPWNVLDNGRLFAQYTGAVAKPISDLFHGPHGGPAAVFYPSVWGPDRVLFATARLPPQLSEGFEGLLLVSESFQYSVDVASGTIQAYMQGRSPAGGFGNKVLGEITALNRALLSLPDGTTVPCTVDRLEAADPSQGSWSIGCDAGHATPGSRFRFPLRLEVSTSDGRELVIDGALVGVWDSEKRTMLLPAPDDVSAALTASEPAARILQNHPIAFYNYIASISSEGAVTAAGEVILTDDLQFEGRSVPYTLATPFSVEGQSVAWSLTEEELDRLILDVVQTPLVTRALASLPDVTLNLYYAEVMDTPELPWLLNASPPDYSISLAPCGDVASLQVPDSEHPLRAFSLGGTWEFAKPEFVLVDGTPTPFNLDLRPNGDDTYSIDSLLTPSQLDTGSAAPFGRIWLQSDSWLGDGPELSLWVPRGIDPTTTEPYSRILSALPAAAERWAGNIWVVGGMTLMVAPDGSLQATACADQ
jgi:hypothetical protein